MSVVVASVVLNVVMIGVVVTSTVVIRAAWNVVQWRY
jgi:hypothetical protein